MNIDDFRFMRRGKHLTTLSQDRASLLLPIKKNIHSEKDSALLMLHGFSSSPAVFRDLIPMIDNYDVIVSPVLPGHGDSIAVFSDSTAQSWVQEAEKICTQLMSEYKKVDVLGLSLGGLLACHLCQHFLFNHLFLLAPALKLRTNINLLLWYGRLLKTLGFKFLRNRAGNLHTNRSSELAYRQLPVNTAMELLTYIQHFNFIPPQCPVDLFLGKHDAVVNSAEVAQLFASLKNAKIHWLEHSAHVLPLDGDVASIISCIQNT